jgi:hypothetical protein
MAIESGWGGEGLGASETVVVYVTNERPFLFIRMHIRAQKKRGEEKMVLDIHTERRDHLSPW